MSFLPLSGAASFFTSGAPLKAASNVVSSTGSAFASLLQRAVAPQQQTELKEDSKPAAATTEGTVNGIDVAKLHKENTDQIQTFAAKFRALLKEAGIEPIGGIELQLGDMGQLQVAGNPLDKSKIESILSSHPELATQFRQIAANAGVLRAIEESARCQQSGDASGAPTISTDQTDSGTKFSLNVLPDHTETSFSAKSALH